MSWWVYLEDEHGNPVDVDCHKEGGTYAMFGTSVAELNITYNYGKHYGCLDQDNGLRINGFKG
jgi:hypothetical protein